MKRKVTVVCIGERQHKLTVTGLFNGLTSTNA